MPTTENAPPQPLEIKVDPRRWTTKVNIAVVIGVAVVFLIGAAYAFYAATHPGEVQQEINDDVTPAGR